MRNAMATGARVYLRPFEKSDAETFARENSNETETFMNRGRLPVSPLSMEHWIDEVHRHQPPEEVRFAVCLKENDRCIGEVGLESIDWTNRVAETGSWLFVPEYRGKGYGTEAKFLLLEYAFDRIQMELLYSIVFEPNTRSAAALAKQGYRPAGRIDYADIKDGEYRALLHFDLTRDDWLKARDAWQAQRA